MDGYLSRTTLRRCSLRDSGVGTPPSQRAWLTIHSSSATKMGSKSSINQLKYLKMCVANGYCCYTLNQTFYPTRYMLFRNPQACSALGELRLLQPQALGFLSHIDPLNLFKQQCTRVNQKPSSINSFIV